MIFHHAISINSVSITSIHFNLCYFVIPPLLFRFTLFAFGHTFYVFYINVTYFFSFGTLFVWFFQKIIVILLLFYLIFFINNYILNK